MADNNGVSNDDISDEELDARYREIVDSFIDHANELSQHNSIENVGLAMLFAASRFNAYVVSQHAESQAAYAKDCEGAKRFFQAQYEQMLEENLNDYGEVFNKYANFTKPQ